jgi:hypothetical protein
VLSTSPDGGPPVPIEVKGWGESLRLASGAFRYHQDIRASQFEAAGRDPSFRVEIVANITEYVAGRGPYERLTIRAELVRSRAVPRLFDVPLSGLEAEIRTVAAAAPPASARAAWSVVGRPTPFAGGKNEADWRAAIVDTVPPASDPSVHSGIRVRFALSGSAGRPRKCDLDNLLDPVISSVVNKRGWCGGKRTALNFVQAEKLVADTEGADIELLESPTVVELVAESVLLDAVYDGACPTSALDPVFAAWVQAVMTETLGERRASVALTFSDSTVNLGEVSTGRLKPLIDGLWPLLGGTPAAPQDERIDELLLVRRADAPSGVQVWVAALD